MSAITNVPKMMDAIPFVVKNTKFILSILKYVAPGMFPDQQPSGVRPAYQKEFFVK